MNLVDKVEAISWIESDWRYSYLDAISTGWQHLQSEYARKKNPDGLNAIVNIIDDPRVRIQGVPNLTFNVIPRRFRNRKKEVAP